MKRTLFILFLLLLDNFNLFSQRGKSSDIDPVGWGETIQMIFILAIIYYAIIRPLNNSYERKKEAEERKKNEKEEELKKEEEKTLNLKREKYAEYIKAKNQELIKKINKGFLENKNLDFGDHSILYKNNINNWFELKKLFSKINCGIVKQTNKNDFFYDWKYDKHIAKEDIYMFFFKAEERYKLDSEFTRKDNVNTSIVDFAKGYDIAHYEDKIYFKFDKKMFNELNYERYGIQISLGEYNCYTIAFKKVEDFSFSKNLLEEWINKINHSLFLIINK